MDEEFIAKLAHLYNSFRNTLESKIKDKEISFNNDECYLIKDYDNKLNKIIKNYELCRKYNRYSFESSCSLPEPPDFINGISSMINCLKNNTNYKLIQKEVIHLINKKNNLNNNKGQLVKYYTGNYKIIIEFIGKTEHKALLLDRTFSRYYTPFLIKRNNNHIDIQLYNDILSIKDNITSFLSRNMEYNDIIISKERFLEKKNLSPPFFNKRNLNNNFKNKFSINLIAVDEEKAKLKNKRIGHRRHISDLTHRDIIENIKVDNMAEGINNMTVKDTIEEKKEEEENKINENDKEVDLLNISTNKDIFQIELDNKKIEFTNDNYFSEQLTNNNVDKNEFKIFTGNENKSEELKEKNSKMEILENEIKLINKKYSKREEEYLDKIKNYEEKILIIEKENKKLKEDINKLNGKENEIQDLINKLNNSKINNYNLKNIISDLENKINQKENELKNLKNELNEKKNQLKNLEQKFDIGNIIINKIKKENQNLKKIKDDNINEINMHKKEVLYLRNKLNSQKRNININEMMCVNFISLDQNINYSIPCTKSDIFAEIEEKLYKEYPQYRDTNNVFLYNGDSIHRFKTISENKIESGKPIILNIFQ